MALENKGNSGAYTEAYYDQYESTLSNGEARIPICICVDTSSSMAFLNNDSSEYEHTEKTSFEDGKTVRKVNMKPGCVPIRKIDRLHTVLQKMIDKMQKSDIISKAAVICIISFDQFADCFIEFTDVTRIRPSSITNLEVGKDSTNSSKGIKMSLDRIDRLVAMNSDAGNDRFVPVFIFMSDGVPTDGEEADRAREMVRHRSENGKLNVIPISICGDASGERWLRGLSADSKVYRMDNERDFTAVFDGITERIKRTTLVIAVDENDSNMVAEDDQDSTKYGPTCSLSDLESFMNESFI